MDLDAATIKKIADLARIKLTPEHVTPMQQDLNKILHFIEELAKLDTSGVGLSVTESETPLRLDIINDGGYVDKILANAPEVSCNMFVVPKIVE